MMVSVTLCVFVEGGGGGGGNLGDEGRGTLAEGLQRVAPGPLVARGAHWRAVGGRAFRTARSFSPLSRDVSGTLRGSCRNVS